MNFFELNKKYDCFVLGNVWDTLSAIILEQKGFLALGTTSWGIANVLGYNDGEKISFSDYFDVIKRIKSAINIPLSIDIESGFSQDENQIICNILSLAEIGCLAINIEDSSKEGIKDKDTHKQLIYNIKNNLLKNGYSDFFVNARIDTYLQSGDALQETIIRAKAYESAGADGIFVPCLTNIFQIQSIIKNINIPLNIMSLPNCTNVNEMRRIGVKRFSLGNAMSDAVISYIEDLCSRLLVEQKIDILFAHNKIKTRFKD